MSGIVIVPVNLEYAYAFRACLDEVARESKMLAMLQAPPLDLVAQFLAENVRYEHPQFFAIDQEDVVGWIDINRFSQPGQEHRGTLGMGVRKSHRGFGVGRKLMMNALSCAKRKGFEKIELDVFTENTAAINLYISLGFREEGRVQKYRKLEGQYQDVINMALFF